MAARLRRLSIVYMNIIARRIIGRGTERQGFPINGGASDANIMVALEFDQQGLRGRLVAVVWLSRKTPGPGEGTRGLQQERWRLRWVAGGRHVFRIEGIA